MTFLKGIFLIVFLFSAPLWSGVKQVWEMENMLRARVKNVLNSYDQTANVSVKIETKKIAVNLPGTVKKKSQVLILDDSGAISEDSISKVVIQITTHTANNSGWLEAEIRKEVNMGKIPVDVKVTPFSNQQKEAMKNVAKVLSELNSPVVFDSPMKEKEDKSDISGTPSAAPSSPQINVQIPPSPMSDWFFWQQALLPTAALLLLGFVLHARSLKRLVVNDLKSVVSASKSENSLPVPGLQNIDGSQRQAFSKMPMVVEKWDNYTADFLSFLLSDCYWCEKDASAAYVWRRVSQLQQNQIIKLTGIPIEYFKIISEIEEKNEGYHVDPVYLSGNPWMQTDQFDLLKVVRNQPSIFHQLSRMRQETLGLSIAERIQIQKISVVSQAPPPVNLPPSAPRKLDLTLKIKSVTFDDELWLLDNHNLLEEKDILGIPSLVWLVLSPSAESKTILESLDARSLASAWYGHPVVLEKVSKLISEAKLKNLNYFLGQQTVNVDSDEFSFLTSKARNCYLKFRKPKEIEQKKAA